MLKRVTDVTIATLLLVVLSPVLLAVAVAIKATSPGPILFRQARVGLRGKQFTLYKFRSMRTGLQKGPGQPIVVADFHTFVFSPPGPDTRVTPIGRLIRATSLDELPQLHNVLKGDMSLVGPRPELPEIVEQYPDAYHRRHDLLPGITGAAQISGRSDLTYHEIMVHDLDYVARHPYWRDVAILIRTIGVVLRGKGAR